MNLPLVLAGALSLPAAVIVVCLAGALVAGRGAGE